VHNFAAVLDHNVARWPEKVILSAGSRQLTNRTFFHRVNSLAAGLRERDIGRGDVVALLLYNHPEFLATVFATNRIGAAFLPMNYRLSPAEWRYILEHSQAKAILTEPEFAAGVQQAAEDVPTLQHLLLLAANGEPPWTGLETLLQAHSGATVPVADVGGDEPQRLMYTSGTTARPKGVVITHDNLAWKNLSHIIEFGITEADSTLVCGPLYHVGGHDLPGVGTLHAGGSLILLRKFDAAEVLATIEHERPSNIWLAPAMMNAVLQQPDLAKRDTSSIRFIIGGGEKMPEPLISQVVAAFPNAWFSDAYGLTETASGDTFNDADHMLAKAGSVGRPVAHLQVRIVRDDGEAAAPGELGEIALKGPKVFSGYWRDDEATQNALRNGWFHTGDVGRIDDDGYLYVEDRKKDLIVSGGENIASPEVERVLYEHPDVLEAAVIGMPHPKWGEVPKAYVVLHEGRDAGPAEDEALRTYCRERLAKYKAPAAVEFLAELPRTPSGKVLKRMLGQQNQTQTPQAAKP
jgi:O-succinylbenzoate-CoA ligase